VSPTADLSAIVITHNEQKNLADCIASLAFCREIIVVDYASTDETVTLARSLGCKVIQTPDWLGFGVQKQRALLAASCSWVLSIDADERVTPQLQAAILGALGASGPGRQAGPDNASGPSIFGYQINRQSFFLGHPMRFGGWSPDWILRLAYRQAAYFDSALVHESLWVNGPKARLAGPLLHYSYPTIEDVLRKQATYALLGATKRSEKGRSHGVWVALAAGLAVFIRSLILQLGFLDGRYGLLAAAARAQETFWKYAATRYLSTSKCS